MPGDTVCVSACTVHYNSADRYLLCRGTQQPAWGRCEALRYITSEATEKVETPNGHQSSAD